MDSHFPKDEKPDTALNVEMFGGIENADTIP